MTQKPLRHIAPGQGQWCIPRNEVDRGYDNFSFTAGGNSFPVAVTVSGLTKKEMPPGEDFIHVEIPGMCIGGGDVGVGVGSSQQVVICF